MAEIKCFWKIGSCFAPTFSTGDYIGTKRELFLVVFFFFLLLSSFPLPVPSFCKACRCSKQQNLFWWASVLRNLHLEHYSLRHLEFAKIRPCPAATLLLPPPRLLILSLCPARDTIQHLCLMCQSGWVSCLNTTRPPCLKQTKRNRMKKEKTLYLTPFHHGKPYISPCLFFPPLLSPNWVKSVCEMAEIAFLWCN